MLYFKTVENSTLELLKGLQGLESLKDTRLVGGTALALQYGHRISVDLDLFAHNLASDLMMVIAEIKSKGYSIELRRQSPGILIAMIQNVKVDIVNYPYPWIDSGKKEENIILASDKDIAAMKLSAITNRGTKKDFIDLYFLLKYYSLEQMLSFYSEKYDEGSSFMVLKSLTYFDDAETDPSPNIFDKTLTWSAIKSDIIKAVRQLIL